jgi:hypothetical protein
MRSGGFFIFMPIEGLPTDSANNSAETQKTTSDATDKNTDVSTVSGTDTQAAQQTEAQPQEKTITQADVDRIVQNRLKSAVKAEIKKLTGEGENTPNVEDLQRQLSERDQKIRSFEAKDKVSEFLSDGRNKLNVRPENIRGIEALVIPLLDYDEDGKPSNLRDAIETAKSIAPALFVNSTSNINANSGNGSGTRPTNMNDLIRQQAGIG